MGINVVVWCEQTDSEEYLTYKMQVSGVSRKSEKKVLRETQDWACCGEGWDPRNSRSLFLFKRDFLDKSEMLEWAHAFTYPVKELIVRSGREVEIKKKEKKKKDGRKTKRVKSNRSISGARTKC
jgi:hypothetical protein